MQKFLNHDAVQFVAGRIFPHGGRTYYPGDLVEDARSWPNLESAVRSKYLWPVAEDLSEIPHRMQQDVKPMDQALSRLNADRYVDAVRVTQPEAEPEPEGYDPQGKKINDVLDYLSVNPAETEAVLERERSSKQPRVRLITALEERLTAPKETIDV
jgi:hypothetical protein